MFLVQWLVLYIRFMNKSINYIRNNKAYNNFFISGIKSERSGGVRVE